MNVERFGGPVPMGIPHLFEDLLAGVDGPGFGREEGQEVEFLPREREFPAVEDGSAGAEIDSESISDADRGVDGFVTARGASRHRMDAGDEFAESERFDQIIVGTKFESEHPVDLVTARGHHDDRDRRGNADAPTDLVPVDVGETEIEQHDLGMKRTVQHLDAGEAGGFASDDESLTLETVLERLGDCVVVFDDQEVHDDRVSRSRRVNPRLCRTFTLRGAPASHRARSFRFMNRHLALTFAGATAILVTAATGAIAANVGILGSGAPKSVGNLSASSVVGFATTTVAPGAPVNVAVESGASADSAIVPGGPTASGAGANPTPGAENGSTNEGVASGSVPTSPPSRTVTPPEDPPAPSVTTSPYDDDDDDDGYDDGDDDDRGNDYDDDDDGEDDDD